MFGSLKLVDGDALSEMKLVDLVINKRVDCLLVGFNSCDLFVPKAVVDCWTVDC